MSFNCHKVFLFFVWYLHFHLDKFSTMKIEVITHAPCAFVVQVNMECECGEKWRGRWRPPLYDYKWKSTSLEGTFFPSNKQRHGKETKLEVKRILILMLGWGLPEIRAPSALGPHFGNTAILGHCPTLIAVRSNQLLNGRHKFPPLF